MFTPTVRWCLLLLLPAFALSTGRGQPPAAQKAGDNKIPEVKLPRADYTAFPDLKPWTFKGKEVKGPDGKPLKDMADKIPFVLPSAIPELEANAPALRKVRYEQFYAGMSYLLRVYEKMAIAGPDNNFQQDLIFSTEVFRLGAEFETKPAEQIVWYEARVRTFKQLEAHVELLVKAGNVQPKEADLARFRRLQAEADLLRLKAEVQKVD